MKFFDLPQRPAAPVPGTILPNGHKVLLAKQLPGELSVVLCEWHKPTPWAVWVFNESTGTCLFGRYLSNWEDAVSYWANRVYPLPVRVVAPKGVYVVVLSDGETWAPLQGCAIYRLKSDKPLAFADNLDEVLGDENPKDAPLQNVQAVIADVQLQELLDEYTTNAPDACAPCLDP